MAGLIGRLLPDLGGLMISIEEDPVRQPGGLLSPGRVSGRGPLVFWERECALGAGTGSRRPLRVAGPWVGRNDLGLAGVLKCLRRGGWGGGCVGGMLISPESNAVVNCVRLCC